MMTEEEIKKIKETRHDNFEIHVKGEKGDFRRLLDEGSREMSKHEIHDTISGNLSGMYLRILFFANNDYDELTVTTRLLHYMDTPYMERLVSKGTGRIRENAYKRLEFIAGLTAMALLPGIELEVLEVVDEYKRRMFKLKPEELAPHIKGIRPIKKEQIFEDVFAKVFDELWFSYPNGFTVDDERIKKIALELM